MSSKNKIVWTGLQSSKNHILIFHSPAMLVPYFLVCSLTIAFILLSTAVGTCPAVEACLSTIETCTTLPMPTVIPPLPLDSFVMREIRRGVYSFWDGNFLSLVIFESSKGHLIIIDAPRGTSSFTSDGTFKLNSAIAEVLGSCHPSRISMVYGHRHFDHIGGAPFVLRNLTNRYINTRIKVWGAPETKTFLAQRSMAMPNVTNVIQKRGSRIVVSPSIVIKLLRFNGHVFDDVAVYLPPSNDGEGILHIADYVTPDFTPFYSFSQTVDLGAWVNTHQKLLNLDFKILSPGHARLGGKNDLRINMQFTKNVIKFSRQAQNEITQQTLQDAGFFAVFDPSAVQYGNLAFSLKSVIDIQADFCIRKVIENYGCILGGVVEFARSQCIKAIFFLQIDSE